MTAPGVLVEPGAAPPGRRSWLVCAGCGAIPPADAPFTPRCPARREGDDIDHLLRRVIDPRYVEASPDPDPDPFVRYRTRFHAYQVAIEAGWSDGRYVDLVRRLDDAVASVDGRGFRTTPLLAAPALAEAIGMPGHGLWVKDETGNVSGSHKARHLMAVMLELQVAEALGTADPARPLAIASCGNAALAAAVVARAAERELRVFVPPHGEPAVLERLARLGARVETCPRQVGQIGDPSYLRLQAALAEGAVPFTCQGTENGLVIEGGATLGWELIDQLAERDVTLDRLVVQVGGGALAASQALAFEEAQAIGDVARLPRLDTVQTTGAWPLSRAFDRLAARLGAAVGEPCDLVPHADALAEVAHHRSAYMSPWESEPHSIAGGILDDETYDWFAVVQAMLATGGRPIIADEATLEQAERLGCSTLGIDADATGTAGLAGLIRLAHDGHLAPGEQAAVIFSGIRRAGPPSAAPETLQGPGNLQGHDRSTS